MSEIECCPSGWVLARIEEITIPVNTLNPNNEPHKKISYLDIGSINNEFGIIEKPKNILGSDAPSRARQIVYAGDTIYSTVRPYLQAIAMVPTNLMNPVASTGFCVLRPNVGINNKYLFYFVRSDQFLQEIVPLQRGVSYPAVRSKDVLSRKIPLPPLREQNRIIDKLEELFSEIDSGIKELKAAQIKLRQYRHSLLKSAIEGSLTQKWRTSNNKNIKETGKELLEQILIDRREQWQQKKLEEFKNKDKSPPKGWKDKYPEPVKPETKNLPKLPEGWVWASLDMIIGNIEAGKSFKCLERHPEFDEYGVVKVSAVSWGEYDELESKTCTRTDLENDNIIIKEGDFLFSRANTTELVGACVIVKRVTKKIMLSDKILRFKFIEDKLKFWILQFMRGELGRTQIEYAATGNQASMKNVSQGKLLKFAVPLPPLHEVEEVQGNLLTAFENLTNSASEAETTLKFLNAQRKNILKSAFSGQLVSQDPNDEPASLLLKKVKAEREELAKVAKHKRTKKVPTMNEITVINLTKWLNKEKENSFTFEQIQKEFQGDYDQLKECIFKILSEKKPLIKQFFDQEANTIKFIKEDK